VLLLPGVILWSTFGDYDDGDNDGDDDDTQKIVILTCILRHSASRGGLDTPENGPIFDLGG
jgi:hypothetical protein